ncbi:MAG: protein kinase [Gemmatimonadetes bacterium]|nr:protein kinase [Gemmatimonadota bacterium]
MIETLNAALEGRYRIERKLGEGGMATVFLARDLKHNRQVAIKVLRPELAAVVGADRFLAEIETTANLQHPHILPLFDSGGSDGLLWYAMPYIEGESLRDRLDREGQLPVAEAVALAGKVASALGRAHEAGVLHRDIKPANILLSGGEPLVADFGIALALGAAGGGRLTETGLSVGTPYYMSPEQATGEQNVGPPSDVYALGCVLYEMLIGEPPYSGGSAQAVLGKIIAGAPVTPTAVRPTIPRNVDAAIRCALEKVPADRFPTADAFAQALNDPAYRHGPEEDSAGARGGAGLWKAVALGASVVAVGAIAVAMFGGAREAAGPRDVGLPHDAPMVVGRLLTSMTVSPDGSFVIYEADRGDHQELWVRSLESMEARPIPETRGTYGTPIISPDGSRVAFFVGGELRVTRIDGEGSPSVVGSTNAATGGHWLEDGTIVYSDQDGRMLRWTDPDSGPLRDMAVQFCLYPTLRADETEILCGGGDWKFAYSRATDAVEDLLFWTRSAATGQPGAPVRGSQFREVDDAWLVYLAIDGTLMAAPIEDPEARTVGRSVSFFSDVRREAYTGAGQWDLTPDGTLVFAMGGNAEIGRLVEATADGRVVPLNTGEAAHLRYEPSPDETRLATVVEAVQGHELRLYDLRTGTSEVIDEGFFISYPAWSPDGRSLVYTRKLAPDGGFALVRRELDGTSEPIELLTAGDGYDYHQPSSYLSADSLLLGVTAGAGAALLIDPRTAPPRVDTLPIDPYFVAISPDRRWIAWSPQGADRTILQTWPDLDRRYAVSNEGGEGRWLSDGRLVFYGVSGEDGSETESTGGRRFYTVEMNPDGQGPPSAPEILFSDPRWSDTPGWSHTPSADGGLVYLQSSDEIRIHYLRVIPGWVDQMKAAVGEANR